MRTLLLSLLLLRVLTAWAQIQPDAMNTASGIKDAGGNQHAPGMLSFIPIDQPAGLPMNFAAAGDGQHSTAAVYEPVKNGVLTPLQLKRLQIAGLRNAYYRAAATDATGKAISGSPAAQVKSDSECAQMPSGRCSAGGTIPSNGSHATRYASEYATGGSGTSASPWTGWETAVTTAPANSHIHFPAGYYNTATGISPTANGLLLTGDGSIATVIRATAAMPYVVGLPSNGTVRQLSIRDMYFEANNLATYGIFDFDNTNYDRSVIENVGTSDAVSHGVVVRRCQMCTLQNVSSWSNGGHGFSFEGANASVGIGLTASGSKKDGIAVRQCTDTTGHGDCALVGMTLQVAVGTSDTTMTVDDASYLPTLPVTFKMAYKEQVTITAETGKVLAVTRGANSTTATAWPAGTQMTGAGGAPFSGGMTFVSTQSESNAHNGASINAGAPVVFTGGWFEANGGGSTTTGDGFRISGPNVVINGIRVTAAHNDNARPSIWAVHLLPGAQNAQIGSMMVGTGGGTGDSQYYAPNIDASLSSGIVGPLARYDGVILSPQVNLRGAPGVIAEKAMNTQQLNKGAVNGYAPLNSGGQPPAPSLPTSATNDYVMTWSSPAVASSFSGSTAYSIMRTARPIKFNQFSLLIANTAAAGAWTTQPSIQISDGTNTCRLAIPNATYLVYGTPVATAGTGCSFAANVTLTMSTVAGMGGTQPNPGKGNIVASYCMTGTAGC
jgi:hypothetical protein